MKKQIKPSIKAHLLRGAFYLLLLVAVCAIPFALAQRNTTKRSVVSSQAQSNIIPNLAGVPPASGVVQTRENAVMPSRASSSVTSGATGGSAVKNLPLPKYPNVVLYDQYDNDLNNGIVSANRTSRTYSCSSAGSRAAR